MSASLPSLPVQHKLDGRLYLAGRVYARWHCVVLPKDPELLRGRRLHLRREMLICDFVCIVN
jgi:hypothetical protein